jgi:hypothetical protein
MGDYRRFSALPKPTPTPRKKGALVQAEGVPGILGLRIPSAAGHTRGEASWEALATPASPPSAGDVKRRQHSPTKRRQASASQPARLRAPPSTSLRSDEYRQTRRPNSASSSSGRVLSRYWSRYNFTDACKRAFVVTAPEIFTAYFFNHCEQQLGGFSSRKKPDIDYGAMRSGGGLGQRLVRYMRTLRSRADACRKTFFAAKERLQRDRAKNKRTIEEKTKHMQYELVSLLQKREFLREQYVGYGSDILSAQIGALQKKIASCEQVLLSVQNGSLQADHEVPEGFFVPATRLLTQSAGVQTARSAEQAHLVELNRLEAQIATVKAKLAREDSTDRGARARAWVGRIHETYESGRVLKHCPLHAEEFEFERILCDQRFKEGRTLALWVARLEARSSTTPNDSKESKEAYHASMLLACLALLLIIINRYQCSLLRLAMAADKV